MIRTFSAIALAATLAYTTFTATPAQAEMSNLGKFILGAGALAAVAYAVKEHQDRKDDRKKVVVQKQRDVEINNYHRYPDARVRKPDNRNQYREQNQIHPGANRHPGYIETRHTLPKSCERTFKVKNGKRTLLPEPCLERNGVYAQMLPPACWREIDVPGDRNHRFGFGKECLKKNGYEIR